MRSGAINWDTSSRCNHAVATCTVPGAVPTQPQITCDAPRVFAEVLKPQVTLGAAAAFHPDAQGSLAALISQLP